MSVELDDLSLERLMKERLWTFGQVGSGDVFASRIAFESGGWLKGYSHDNEHTWRVKGGAVEFLNKSAQVSTRFDTIKSVDGKIEMEGRFALSSDIRFNELKESVEVEKPKNRTALIVPIHDAYFIYGVNLLFQSMGADYDIVFVFSTDADRMQFKEMHQASPFLNYASIVLADYFSGSAMSVIAEKRVWPTIKKFLALSLTHSYYDYLLCVDAETFILSPTGWTAAAEEVVNKATWYAGSLGLDNLAERHIMHASSVALAPVEDLQTIQTMSRDWTVYTWWWDIPVYSSQSVPGFLDWIGWNPSLQFVERLNHSVFDHITYQFYMVLHGGFSFKLVNGVNHAMEFCGAKMVAGVHQQIHPMRWTNALAYSQNPDFFKQNDYLAIYHIDRKTFPVFNPA